MWASWFWGVFAFAHSIDSTTSLDWEHLQTTVSCASLTVADKTMSDEFYRVRVKLEGQVLFWGTHHLISYEAQRHFVLPYRDGGFAVFTFEESFRPANWARLMISSAMTNPGDVTANCSPDDAHSGGRACLILTIYLQIVPVGGVKIISKTVTYQIILLHFNKCG